MERTMDTLTDSMKFKILQHPSGNYLTPEIPDNWKGMEEEEQDKFLTDNAWAPIEYSCALFIREAIYDATKELERFLIKEFDIYSKL